MQNNIVHTMPNREFLVGQCLSRSAGILKRNFVSFLTLAFIVTIPSIVFGYLLSDTENFSARKEVQTLIEAVVYLVQFILSYLVTATIVYGVIADLRGKRATVSEAINKGLPVLLPAFIVAIISAIAFGLGLMLFVVPGIIVMCMLWFSVPVVVAERPGIFASLSRSRQLSKGYRWKIFGLILLAVVIISILSAVVGGGVGIGLSLIIGLNFADIKSYVEFFNELVSTIIFAVISAVAYHDVRIAKEGVSTDDIASVFD